MHPRHGAIVRPLLSCRREELRAFLAARHAEYVEDESNADWSIPRNRIRGELLPLLENRFNPQVIEVLANEAELARDTWQWLESEADRLDVPRTSGPEGALELDIATLSAAPLALRRFLVWRAMSVAAEGRPISFDHVHEVLRLIGSGKSGSIDVPGHRVERVGPNLVLTGRREGRVGRRRSRGQPRNPANLEAAANLFEYPLSIPGEVPVPLAGCALSAETTCGGAVNIHPMRSGAAVAIVRRDLCGSQLRVRNRRPGDRFRPLGVGGHKKLQDFFVDRKVPRQRRDTVPLVVDELDRIVWVAGYGIDEAYQVTDPAQAVLILRLKLLGGPA
jgi:tRNA(Ile)-lysidine synthase